MSVYLSVLIKEVEAEAEKARARLKKIEALNASHVSGTGRRRLKRLMQRLEILRALQQAEGNRARMRRRFTAAPLASSRKTKSVSRGAGAPLESRHKPACWADRITEGIVLKPLQLERLQC